MTFPIYRRQGAVLFLDDDVDFLVTVGDVLPLSWPVLLSIRPTMTVAKLTVEKAALNTEIQSFNQIVQRWREGKALIPQILRYWEQDGTKRFNSIRVFATDYSMPLMNGVQVLEQIAPWVGSRILLTGQADEQLAVKAFNAGLIDRFIPKQSPDLITDLQTTIWSHLRKPITQLEQIWHQTLSAAQARYFDDPGVSNFLEKLSVADNWIEHVVIGSPFGILALKNSGDIRWIQLEPEDHLHDLAELAAIEGVDDHRVQCIRRGETLVALELHQCLGQQHALMSETAFLIEGEFHHLYAADFLCTDASRPGHNQSFDMFLARHASRQVQE